MANTDQIEGTMDSNVTTRQLVEVLVRWRRIVLFNLICITLLGVVVSLVLPKQYTATATVLPPVQESSLLGAGSLLTGALGQFGGLARMAGVSGLTTTSDILLRVLESRAVCERVIRECGLMDIYGVSSMDEALKILHGETSISVSMEGIVTVSVRAGCSERSAEVANSYVKNLDLVNRLTNTSRGRASRIFIEQRLREVEDDLAESERAMREFQEKNKTVSLEDEVVEAIRAAAELKAEIVGREVALGVLAQFATPENPQVKQLASEIAQLRRQLDLMEIGPKAAGDSSASGFGVGFSVPFARVPEVGMELARLTRELEIQNAIYALLMQQYEEAKIAEARDTPTVQVLDRAQPPERKSAPRRTRIVILSMMLGTIAGVSLAFFRERIALVEENPREAGQWADIGRKLSSSFEGLNRNLRRRKR